MRSFVALTLVAAIGCRGGAASRTTQSAPADTMVINSRLSIALPDHVVPWRIFGKPTYNVSPAAVAHSPHAKAVQCDTAGNAMLTVANRFTTRRVLVLCRPIRGFFPFQTTRIPLERGPVQMPLVPNTGLDGRAVTLLAGTSRVRDTSVLRFKEGFIHPKKIGFTRIDMVFAGLYTAMSVEVYETVASDTLELAGGEFKSWRITPGRYEINLAVADTTAPLHLALGAYNLNCGPGRNWPRQMHCAAYQDGSVFVRNTRKPGTEIDRDARLSIIRQAWMRKYPVDGK